MKKTLLPIISVALAITMLTTSCLTINEKQVLSPPWVPEYRNSEATESILYIVNNNNIDWSTITGVKALKLVYGTVYKAEDAEATFKLASDNANIYFNIEVSDNNLRSTSLPIADAWNADSVEIFIGQETKKHTTFAKNDHALRIALNENGNAVLGLDNKEIESDAKYEIIDNGYILTFSISLEMLNFVPFKDGEKIRAEYGLNDEDGSSGRDLRLHWANKLDEAYANPSLWGDVSIKEIKK